MPVSHLGDVRALFDGIPLGGMNTSMTINAPAMWLLALYQVTAEEQGVPAAQLAGTTRNDVIREDLSRGTYVFPPGPSLRLITDMVAHKPAKELTTKRTSYDDFSFELVEVMRSADGIGDRRPVTTRPGEPAAP